MESGSVDIERLNDYVNRGLVRKQCHPIVPYTIWNYTQSCQFNKDNWDEVTRMCRGLITEDSGKIIARPFEKFFNVEEHEGEDCSLPPLNWGQRFTAFDKLDGSLGITYYHPEIGWQLATRGSFTSDQAIKGTQMLRCLNTSFLKKENTYLFEIVYPENRIVVDYGDYEGLFLLDVINIENKTHWQAPSLYQLALDLNCRCVEVAKDYQRVKDNAEGYVLRFSDGTRAKIKFEEYKRLHRILTGINSRRIWEILMNNDPIEEILERVPDEFFAWVKTEAEKIKSHKKEIEDICKGDYANAPKHNRKDFAEYAKEKQYPSVLFTMFDKRDPDPLLWKLVKPKVSVPFTTDTDE